MLACKFLFISYFYVPLKTCNFNYSNLLLLMNFSVGKGHCNHVLQPHQWYLLKLTNYVKVKCLYEVIFFLYSIVYLYHNMQLPLPVISVGALSPLPNFKKVGSLRFQRGLLGRRDVTFIRESCNCYIKSKLKSEIFNKRSL